jgi:hypothetical protein
MPGAVKEFDYTEFRKGLGFFADPDSWLVCRNACKGGNGGPPFCVRNCCEQHKVDICFECEEFPCEKTVPFEVDRNGSVVRSKRRIKALRATPKSIIGFLPATLRQNPERGPTIESNGLANSPLIHNARLPLTSGHHVRQTAGNR